jgi:maltose/moltooligosaccharide transporter
MSQAISPDAPHQKTWKVGTLTYTKWGLVSIFTWMLWGDLVFTLTGGVFPGAMPLQLERLHISQFYIPLLTTFLSTAVFLPMNPILSFRSDRYRSRWGRRIPYIFKTLFPLAICMAALGYSDEIGEYIRNAQWIANLGISPMWAIMIVMGVVILLFDFFNVFINTIYWYLFADVIPKELMGRFFSLFRIVGMFAGSLFGWFVQEYIETKTKYIYLGAAALYLFGFGLMCWKVREGEYPPPKDITSRAPWYIRLKNTIKVYFEECFRHPVHVNLYITTAMVRVSEAGMFGMIYFYRQHLHISQLQMGHFGALFNPVPMLLAFPLGWLVDKIHPMRAALISMACVIPLSFAGLYMDSFWFYMFFIAARTPFLQLYAAAEIPLYVNLFPRKQYGQFASANGSVRSLVQLFSVVLGAWFINSIVERIGPKGDSFGFIWLAIFQAIAFGCMFITYLYWKKHGGVNFSYDPEKVVVEGASIEEAESPAARAQEQAEEAHPEIADPPKK